MSTFAAIDIGATKVAVIIAEIDDAGGPRLAGIGTATSRGLRKGHVVDNESTARAVAEAIRKAEAMAGRTISDVTVAISGDAIQSLPSRGLVPILNPSRTITREDVHRVINHSKQTPLPEDRELILAVPRTYKVDSKNRVAKPVGMSGTRLEAETLLITAPAEQLGDFSDCIQEIGYDVESWIPKALASGEAVTKPGDREAGVAVVDIGGDSMDIAVYVDGSVAHIATLPVGSQHITKDISVLLKTTLAEAERLKLDAGTCGKVAEDEAVYVEQSGTSQRRPFERRVLAEIITARAKEMTAMALDSIEEVVPLSNLRSGLVLTGGGSQLTGLAEFAKSLVKGTPVRIGYPEPFPGLGDALAGTDFATSAGLLRFGVRLRDQEGVAAETGDLRKLIKSFGTIFSTKGREDGN